MQTVSISVEGMSCQHCVKTVQGALAAAPGVTSAAVDLASKSARVEFDPAATSVAKLMQAVNSTGFQATGFKKE